MNNSSQAPTTPYNNPENWNFFNSVQTLSTTTLITVQRELELIEIRRRHEEKHEVSATTRQSSHNPSKSDNSSSLEPGLFCIKPIILLVP